MIPGKCRCVGGLLALLAFGVPITRDAHGGNSGAAEFRSEIRPLLEKYCFDCHGDGASKGEVAFDTFKSDQAALADHDLWWKALKNLRTGVMPPAKKARPTPAEQEKIAHWIKGSVFGIDPRDPDPGRVTVRRLNRAEYRNTVRDLLGVEFDAQAEFPPDDSGYGFDNIGDVLTLPPMLLEKYLVAAKKIIGEAVPNASRLMPVKTIGGKQFHGGGSGGSGRSGKRGGGEGSLSLSYYEPAAVSNTLAVEFAGKYQLALDLKVNEKFVDNIFDYNKCRVLFNVDGRELFRHEYSWEGGKTYHYDFEESLTAGDHELQLALEPLTPDEKQTRTLSLQLTSVTLRGPDNREHWTRPAKYAKIFPKEPPDDAKGRRAYARELLANFARKAFRRPVDDKTADRLTALAETVYTAPGKSFEQGVAQGMVAVLASPRFIFREEEVAPDAGRTPHPAVDEYALASRLSYFLWSSMPDAELTRLAGEGKLRANLPGQLDRMLKDHRAESLVRDFTGQWLRSRDIESVPIEARPILAREEKFDAGAQHNRQRLRELRERSEESLSPDEKKELAALRATFGKGFNRQPRADMTYELRRDMRLETEGVVGYVLREDRSLLELIDSDYTFLTERLAKHYGVSNVYGDEMRRVTLPAGSPRGGILTEGTVLAVTSNPTRTSPVKRGVFILDNILGSPPPPPPPNIPPLEDAAKGAADHPPLLRETLARHRADPLCASCHDRMDPLGLALENFNAMGMWRETEYAQPIDAAGKLLTGEKFANVSELKHILAHDHARDFYRTITEKMLTYALGRGLEYYDVETVDNIVAQLEKSGGRPSVLLTGIVQSAPFQKTRRITSAAAVQTGPRLAANSNPP